MWTEIRLKVPVKDIELAESMANMVVPHGIYIEDYSNLENEAKEIAHTDLIDEDLLSKNRDIAIIHVYIKPEENPNESIAFLRERLAAAKIENDISMSSCDVDSFINNWKKYFKPINVGESLVICPTWEKIDDKIKGKKVVKIDPGLAFGTGAHETTKLCLEMMEKVINENGKVLDIGCGSGILGVASLLLGAKSVLGVDIDELAVKTAIENAKINSVQDKFTVVAGNLVDKVQGKFDIIFANIVADVLIDLNEKIEKYMHQDTIYIMSGIIDAREKDVLDALPECMNILHRREENGWVALMAALKK